MTTALAAARTALDQTLANQPLMADAAKAASLLSQTINTGGKILICGNGGSSCDAAHFAEELTGRFRADRRPLAAIACTDVGHITCTANDYGFDHIFSRWVEALGKRGDTLIILSTSGNSANCLRALEAADELGMNTIAMLGKGGGKMLKRATIQIVVPGETSDRIQELHMLLLHTFVECIEAGLTTPHANS
ncbi:MAG: SIS domain-containing protein [Planctomycetes bacterium]|nr:SIS domain-containing protein [Planctomycetota bacterium]